MATAFIYARDVIPISSLDSQPLGGTTASAVDLAKALASRGHDVFVSHEGSEVGERDGVFWGTIPPRVKPDVEISSGNPSQFARWNCRKLLWMHNTANYLYRPQCLRQLARSRPTLVFLSEYARAQAGPLAYALPKRVIPHGVASEYLSAQPPVAAPMPTAIFASNPLRGLDWLLDRWTDIRREVPAAALVLYTGPSVYGAWGAQVAPLMAGPLARAAAMSSEGVHLRDPVGRRELSKAMAESRVMLYRGDAEETYCRVVADAQASGLPVVITRLGSASERVRHRTTGFVATGESEFVEGAVSLLVDDELWSSMSSACVKLQRGRSWDQVAADFESTI